MSPNTQQAHRDGICHHTQRVWDAGSLQTPRECVNHGRFIISGCGAGDEVGTAGEPGPLGALVSAQAVCLLFCLFVLLRVLQGPGKI